MNIIEFPIGDWSGDGHMGCKYFLASSQLGVEEVRYVHLSLAHKGIDIGSIAHKHENELVPEKIYANLREDGFPVEWYITPDYLIDRQDRHKGLFDLWIAILNFYDKRLQLKPFKIRKQPINFFGYQDFKGKKVHLKTPGYGLFG